MNVDEMPVVRALHVASIVVWIGGVAFVTLVLLPTVRRIKAPAERLAFFDTAERRFAWVARLMTLIAGATGLRMIIALNLWDRFTSASYWWMHAMVLVWFVFTMMLFVAEPLFHRRRLHERAAVDPERTFKAIERLHLILLAVSVITILGAVAGSHGQLIFD